MSLDNDQQSVSSGSAATDCRGDGDLEGVSSSHTRSGTRLTRLVRSEALRRPRQRFEVLAVNLARGPCSNMYNSDMYMCVQTMGGMSNSFLSITGGFVRYAIHVQFERLLKYSPTSSGAAAVGGLFGCKQAIDA